MRLRYIPETGGPIDCTTARPIDRLNRSLEINTWSDQKAIAATPIQNARWFPRVYAASSVAIIGKSRDAHSRRRKTVSLALVTAARAAEISSTTTKIVRSEN